MRNTFYCAQGSQPMSLPPHACPANMPSVGLHSTTSLVYNRPHPTCPADEAMFKGWSEFARTGGRSQ